MTNKALHTPWILFFLLVAIVCFASIRQTRFLLSASTASTANYAGEDRAYNSEIAAAAATDAYSSEVSPLPDWRIITDCSVFSVDCAMHAQTNERYKEYPLAFTSSNIASYTWKELKKLPNSWKSSLSSFDATKILDVSDYYNFPNEESSKEISSCMRRAKKPLGMQLDLVLADLGRSFDRVSFTVSDYNYAFDMIHDVFEMAWDVLGFRNSFFMVALDHETLKLACRYGYPVISPGKHSNNLKAKVANSKFDASKLLVDRGVSFFFFEMDVFFIKSPRPWLLNQTADIVFSGHQNSPLDPNIGVFSVLANDATREYLKFCLDWTHISPSTHDQEVMSHVWWANNDMQNGIKFSFGKIWDPAPPLPSFRFNYTITYFGPHEVVASELIVPTEQTIAVHPLCGTPLRNPHGKKFVAKELGAWYGFRGPAGEGGYYHRTGPYRRYLWIDGRVLGGYSTVQSDTARNSNSETARQGIYHDEEALRLTIAAAVALARRTNRIFVLPKLVRDRGVHLLWTELDLKSLETLVDVRETNFMSNPKSWYNQTVPIRSLARTAYDEEGRLFLEYDREIKALKASTVELGIDALFAVSTAADAIHQAEALLFNPHFIGRWYSGYLVDRAKHKGRLSTAEAEILEVYRKLRWCQSKGVNANEVASVTKSEWDCYGRGIPVPLY